jgi:hypothetical protein
VGAGVGVDVGWVVVLGGGGGGVCVRHMGVQFFPRYISPLHAFVSILDFRCNRPVKFLSRAPSHDSAHTASNMPFISVTLILRVSLRRMDSWKQIILTNLTDWPPHLQAPATASLPTAGRGSTGIRQWVLKREYIIKVMDVTVSQGVPFCACLCEFAPLHSATRHCTQGDGGPVACDL